MYLDERDNRTRKIAGEPKNGIVCHIDDGICNRAAEDMPYLCTSMKKEYKALNMLMNGRYAVLYKKLAPQVQADVMKLFDAETKNNALLLFSSYNH